MTDTERAYIAGFLDGDGSIMLQIVRRRDYVLRYQIRASVAFYQKVSGIVVLEWIKGRLGRGSIRRRGEMADYTIVGLDSVVEILRELHPYIVLKRRHVVAATRIIRGARKISSAAQLLNIATKVDRFALLNYSKSRSVTSDVVRSSMLSATRSAL